MKMLKGIGIGIGLCLTVVSGLAVPMAKADSSDLKTTFTFTSPVEVPGVGQHLLPAGTYVFKLLDSPIDRHIVQIFNKDETQVLTTILTVTNHRANATGKSILTFSERPAGEPEALKAWFYSGEHYGEQFVYERQRAIVLAKETNEAVLSTPAVLTDAPVAVLTTAPVEAVSPSGDTVETAQVVEAPVVAAVAPAVVPEPVQVASLPKTASTLPLIGLLGLLSLGGGIVLSGLLKHSA
jgi:hypothetical protein